MLVWVRRRWKRDGSANVMGALAAVRNLALNGRDGEGRPLGEAEARRRLEAGLDVETPGAVFTPLSGYAKPEG